MDTHEFGLNVEHAYSLRWGDLKDDILEPVEVEEKNRATNRVYLNGELRWLN